MNFLDICKIADNMSGLQGEITSVEYAVASQNVIVQAVRQGFIDLQLDRKVWKFMLRTKQFNTTVGVQRYEVNDIFGTPDNDHGHWEERVGRKAYYLRDPSSGKSSRLIFTEYNRFRDAYLRAGGLVDGVPKYITADPATNALILDKPAGAVYEVIADYYVEPQILMENSDIPILPSSYHTLLAYKALYYIGGHYSDLSISSTYAVSEAKMQGNLLRDQCPAEDATPTPVA